MQIRNNGPNSCYDLQKISSRDGMLYLLDTGRMAHKFGKWRGALYLVASVVLLTLANLIAEVISILSSQPQPSVALLRWIEIGFYSSVLFLWGYGCYRLYRDHVHHDYYLEADRYQREGW
jgi:hypothetical protein